MNEKQATQNTGQSINKSV